MNFFINLIMLFFIASFAGWCIEVTGKFFVYHRFINRGMLTGPWLPIYGAGSVLVTLIISLIPKDQSSIGTTFVVSVFACGLIEYLASYVMEKKFHARWWDYSTKPMNLNGRVWIGNLLLFGIAGVVVTGFITPPLFTFLDSTSLPLRETIASVLAVIFVVDFVMTHFVLKLVKTSVEKSEADNTEAISKEIRLIFSDKNIFYRRFADAYPDVIYKTERISRRLESIRIETEKFKESLEQKKAEFGEYFEEGKAQLAATLEPSGNIKNSILAKQNELIAMLYDESSASDEMKALKLQIDENSERLMKRRIR